MLWVKGHSESKQWNTIQDLYEQELS